MVRKVTKYASGDINGQEVLLGTRGEGRGGRSVLQEFACLHACGGLKGSESPDRLHGIPKH